MRRLTITTALLLSASSALSACSAGESIQLRYQLAGIDPQQVVRVETVVGVDPADPRMFIADLAYRAVAKGIGYEVLDIDGSGRRVVLVTHDATLGFDFKSHFVFTLLPPAAGAAPPLRVLSRAVGATRNTLGTTAPVMAQFGGTTVDITIADQRCGGEVCAADEACCEGACRRINDDPAFCGGCSLACGSGETCVGAVCRCAGGSACASGASCCPGMGCFDLAADAFNCGACGRACNPGEACVAGACACKGVAACAAGVVCCEGTGCSPAGCPCGPVTCATKELCCNLSMCADVSQSNLHCGGCNQACTPPFACQAGACRCNGQVCGGADICCASGCASLSDDVRNCGACGRACGAGETCRLGSCVCGMSPCAAGQLCCGGTCVSAQEDEANCGACGTRCDPPALCVSGGCSCAGGPACVGNQTCCVPSATPGGCFDLSADAKNCGQCGKACPATQACVLGSCVASGCSCPNGNQCIGGGCTCNGLAACAGTSTCCASGCAELLTDWRNCGACGKQCAVTDLCCNGACTPMSGQNCGSCGMRCTPLIGAQCCICNNPIAGAQSTSACDDGCFCPP